MFTRQTDKSLFEPKTWHWSYNLLKRFFCPLMKRKKIDQIFTCNQIYVHIIAIFIHILYFILNSYFHINWKYIFTIEASPKLHQIKPSTSTQQFTPSKQKNIIIFLKQRKTETREPFSRRVTVTLLIGWPLRKKKGKKNDHLGHSFRDLKSLSISRSRAVFGNGGKKGEVTGDQEQLVDCEAA